jgi:hypothetical protein
MYACKHVSGLLAEAVMGCRVVYVLFLASTCSLLKARRPGWLDYVSCSTCLALRVLLYKLCRWPSDDAAVPLPEGSSSNTSTLKHHDTIPLFSASYPLCPPPSLSQHLRHLRVSLSIMPSLPSFHATLINATTHAHTHTHTHAVTRTHTQECGNKEDEGVRGVGAERPHSPPEPCWFLRDG